MKQESQSPRKRIVKVYPYVDETGVVLYEVVRYEPKEFRCRVPLGAGKFKWSMEGVRKVLYRLDHVVEAYDETIFVVEGEKDADALVALGFNATCCQGSLNGWQPAFANCMKANRVAIFGDNDDAGRQYAAKVSRSCEGVVKDWRVIELPGLEEKGDVSDWLAQGGDKFKLAAIVNAAFERDNPLAPATRDGTNGKPKNGKPSPGPRVDEPWRFDVVKLSTIKPEPVCWLWEPFWIDHDVNLLVGPPNAGKTFTACHLAASVSRGMAWPDGPGKAPLGDVVYLTTENNPAQVLVPRLLAAGADLERIHTWTAKRRVDRNGEMVEDCVSLLDVEAMLHAIDQLPELRLLIVDPITAYMGDVEPNDNREVRKVMNEAVKVAREKQICIVMLSHLKKSMTTAINSIIGAASFTQVARVVNSQFKDPDYNENKRRCLVPVKNNEAVDDITGKRFQIVSAPGTNRGCICWDAEPELRSADDIMSSLAVKASGQGRETASENARNRSQTQLLGVLDALTAPGDGWVSVPRVRQKLGWSGDKMGAVLWEMTQGGILEERMADKPLPNGGVQPGGSTEIRRVRFDAKI